MGRLRNWVPRIIGLFAASLTVGCANPVLEAVKNITAAWKGSNGNSTWIRHSGPTDAYDVAGPENIGGFVFSYGSYYKASNDAVRDSDNFIVRLDDTGGIIWQRAWGTTGTSSSSGSPNRNEESVLLCCPTGNNSFVALGSRMVIDADVGLVYDESGISLNRFSGDGARLGTMLAYKSTGTEYAEGGEYFELMPNSAVQLPSGSIMVLSTGNHFTGTAYRTVLWVHRFSAEGTVQSSRLYEMAHPSDGSLWLGQVKVCMDSSTDTVYAVGSYAEYGPTNSYNLLLFKLSAEGTVQWATRLETASASNVATSTIEKWGTSVIVAASDAGNGYILAFDEEGALLGQRKLSGPRRTRINNITAPYDGTNILVRAEDSNSAGDTGSAVLMVVKPDYSIQWQRSYGTNSGIGRNRARAIRLNDGSIAGQFYLAQGSALFPYQPTKDMVFFQMSADGSFTYEGPQYYFGKASSLSFSAGTLVLATERLSAPWISAGDVTIQTKSLSFSGVQTGLSFSTLYEE